MNPEDKRAKNKINFNFKWLVRIIYLMLNNS